MFGSDKGAAGLAEPRSPVSGDESNLGGPTAPATQQPHDLVGLVPKSVDEVGRGTASPTDRKATILHGHRKAICSRCIK